MHSGEMKFDSTAHKLIRYMVGNLSDFVFTPLEDNIVDDAEILYKGEIEYLRFNKNLYDDMYYHIGEYNIPGKEYDQFMSGRIKDELSEVEKKKESKLRNVFKQAIKLYPRFLYEIGLRGRLDNSSFRLILDQQQYDEVIKQVKRHISQRKGEATERISLLARLGLTIIVQQEQVVLENPKYPHMFVGLSALCKSVNKKHHFTNFIRCDYRGLQKFYSPGIEEVVKILPDSLKPIVKEVDLWMKKKNAKTTVKALHHQPVLIPWKVNYSHKGKSLFGLQADFENLYLFAYFNNFKNIMSVALEVSKISEDFCNWFNHQIPVTECNCKNNKVIKIGGEKKRICGLSNRMDLKNPDTESLKKIKRIVEIYQENIRYA